MRSQALRLWVALARAFSAVESAAARDAARHGLTLAEFGVLEALHHLGPMSLGELQRKVLVSSGGMTWLVNGLERRGLVSRTVSEADRRVRIATLTDEGSDLIGRIFPEHRVAIRDAVSGLTREEQKRATELLSRLARAAKGSTKD